VQEMPKKKGSPRSIAAAFAVLAAAPGGVFALPQESAISEVVVTATRMPDSGAEGPIPTGVIGRGEIEQRMTRNFADLLDDMPGVVTVRTMTADSFLEPEERFGGRLTSAYEDNERGRFGALTMAARGDRGGILGSVSGQKANDFEDGDGNTVDVTGHDGLSWLLKGHWDVRDATRVTLVSQINDPGRSVRLQVSWRGGV